MLFINTRPVDRAEVLNQALARAGIDVIHLPLLALQARKFSPELLALYQQLRQVQIIVVVSPFAVDIGMQYLQQSGLCVSDLHGIQWVAVGKTTAQRLAHYGVESIVPEIETSEGMLHLPVFAQIPNLQAIAFWRGEGGRQLMMQHFSENQIRVLNFVLYERDCPLETRQNIDSSIIKILENTPPYYVCISSEASWKNWKMLTTSQTEVLKDCYYLVLGERLYHIVQQDQKVAENCLNIIQISNLEPNTILSHLTQ